MRTRVYINSRQACIVMAALLALAVSDVHGQLQRFTLQSKQYRLVGDKWYAFFEGKQGDEIIPQRLIVRMKEKGFMENFDFQRFNLNGVSLESRRFLDGFYVLAISPERDPFQVASVLEQTRLFDVLGFDQIGQRHATPNDPLYGQQWNLPRVAMPEGWDITTGNASIILGIIDTGTRYTHEDLDGNTWVNPAEDRNGNGRPEFYAYSQGGDLDGIDNDGNRFVDDLIGWDFYQSDNNPDDSFGHGTNVAGVSSAQTNNYEDGAYRGIAGVSGGWGTQRGSGLMVLCDGGMEPIASLTIQAIEYAARNGARVINISSGFSPEPPGMSNAVSLAVDTFGVVVVASSGNFPPGSSDIRWPARYSNTIAVGATDQNDNVRSYSCRGPQIDVVAPDGVPSTTMAGDYTSSVTGTSFSAPHVAGLAALIRTVNPSLSWQAVRDTIRSYADKVAGMGGNNFTNEYGYGRINAYRTLKAALPQQFLDASFNSNTTLGYSRFRGTTTIASNVVITVEAGKALVVEGPVNGGTNAHIQVYGNVIIEPGVTINGVRITMESAARLVAKGTASQRITFTSTSGSWQGITFTGAGPSNLSYCDIASATMPIKATNTSNLTIGNVTIGNSSFYNGSDNAAMAFYNSSPTISAVTINGQSNSWNGIRFAQGSAGGVSGCTIQNLGLGNGIVVQGGSDPTITGNIEKSPGVTRAAFLFSAG